MAYLNCSLKFSIKNTFRINNMSKNSNGLRQLNDYALVTVYVCQALYDQFDLSSKSQKTETYKIKYKNQVTYKL